MLSTTLAHELAAYQVGPKLRALRLRKKMGLVELGRHTGLSPAMLSKLERGLMFPTLPTLLRIALVFGVGLDHFFEASAPRKAMGIVRKRRAEAVCRAPRWPRGGLGVRVPRLHRDRAPDQRLLGPVPPGGASPRRTSTRAPSSSTC